MKYLQYKENRPRGTFDFPLEYYYVSPSHPRYEMSYHWHTEYEIIHILEGSFLFNLDGKPLQCATSDILFIQDGVLHGGTPLNCTYECIVFDRKIISPNSLAAVKFMNHMKEQHIMLHAHFTPNNKSLHAVVHTMLDALHHRAYGYELHVLGCLYQFFGFVMEEELFTWTNNLVSLKNKEHVRQLKQSLTLIESSYGETLTLNDLAKAAEMSSKYFCQFFQEMTQRTPIDYLNHYRIECACIKLVTTNDTMTEIALTCGFNDISYFIKTFKKYKGTTPKKYLTQSFTDKIN
ncbi:AraC family transcriptional regulator [Lachnospiraceae bacterium ZAX-1]